MRDFQGKVAVITGAGRGIGQGIARRCAEEGMKVVLASIGMETLSRTAAELKAHGVEVLTVQTDVSKFADIENLAQKTLDTFGAIDLLVNNAGVGLVGNVWESTLADWQWGLGVNLWSVIYGIRVFVPLMLAQDTECHIVNVSSAAGLLDGPGLGIYKVTKFGIISLSDTLYGELKQRGSKIGVSVLCPGFVKTDSVTWSTWERNRPAELRNPPGHPPANTEDTALWEMLRQGVESGISVEHVADSMFEAVREQRLYALTGTEFNDAIRTRTENILNGRNPFVFVPTA